MRTLSLALLIAVAAGCGSPGPDNRKSSATDDGAKSDPQAAAEAGKLLLNKEPAGAKGVRELRASAKTGDEVLVVGRVGGRAKPFTPGRAQFLIVGLNLKPAMECDCPWDYCEAPKHDLEASRASVKFVDASGKPLAADAREAFGIKPLSTVVVKGKAVRDDAGNFTVVGTGLFVKEKRAATSRLSLRGDRMPANIDLQQLAVARGAPPAAAPRRRLLARYGLPGLLLAGFAALLAWAGREALSA